MPASALCDLDTFLGSSVPASSSVKCGLLQGWPELMNRNAVLRSTCRWPESITRHQLLLLVAEKGLLWVRAWSSFIQTHLQLSSCVQKGLFQSRACAAALGTRLVCTRSWVCRHAATLSVSFGGPGLFKGVSYSIAKAKSCKSGSKILILGVASENSQGFFWWCLLWPVPTTLLQVFSLQPLPWPQASHLRFRTSGA